MGAGGMIVTFLIGMVVGIFYVVVMEVTEGNAMLVSKAIAECELRLPRSQHCVKVITAKPVLNKGEL